MYSKEELKSLVNDSLDLIEISKYAIGEARERAAKFLVIQAHLASHMQDLEDAKVKASTIEKAQYSQSILNAGGKNITESKVIAEADPEYAQSRECLELIDSEISWVKRHYEIFNNSHILYRQISSDK